jgi:hypothetical protein
MEYTAVLAGEPFTDTPGCVDGELAAVLRHANDRLSDGDRFRLTPLLGRAIGLVVPGPVAPRRRRSARREDGRDLAVHAAVVGELRTSVSRRFTAALGHRYEQALAQLGLATPPVRTPSLGTAAPAADGTPAQARSGS